MRKATVRVTCILGLVWASTAVATAQPTAPPAPGLEGTADEDVDAGAPSDRDAGLLGAHAHEQPSSTAIAAAAATPPGATASAPASAGEPPRTSGNRFVFGDDGVERVGRGETVRSLLALGDDVELLGDSTGDVVAVGGDVVIDGHARANVVALGGDVRVTPRGRVDQDVLLLGGTLNVDDAAQVGGDVVHLDEDAGEHDIALPMGHVRIDGGRHAAANELASFTALGALNAIASTALTYLAVFLVALLMLGVAPRRVMPWTDGSPATLLRALGTGVAAFVLAGLGVVVGFITVVGIPAALVIALLLPVAAYAGLAATAIELGRRLPIPALRERPMLEVLSGVATLAVLSCLPSFGSLVTAIAACLGLGALLLRGTGTSQIPPSADTPSSPGRETPDDPSSTALALR